MARRISSRDDLFVSALDLMTLLLCTFIGLAFLQSHGKGIQDELDLPIIPELSAPASQSRDSSRAIFFAWNGDVDVQGTKEKMCVAAVRRGGMDAPPEMIDIPCWPTAFGGIEGAFSAKLQSYAENGGRAVIICPNPTNSLEACSRLHWLAAEHGFVTAVAVSGAR